MAEGAEKGDFNPLPRKEGDKIKSMTASTLRVDFNPLPRKEGDDQLWSEILWEYISIHSLVKRETQLQSHDRQ